MEPIQADIYMTAVWGASQTQQGWSGSGRVEVDERKFIKVDQDLCSTSAPRVLQPVCLLWGQWQCPHIVLRPG